MFELRSVKSDSFVRLVEQPNDCPNTRIRFFMKRPTFVGGAEAFISPEGKLWIGSQAFLTPEKGEASWDDPEFWETQWENYWETRQVFPYSVQDKLSHILSRALVGLLPQMWPGVSGEVYWNNVSKNTSLWAEVSKRGLLGKSQFARDVFWSIVSNTTDQNLSWSEVLKTLPPKTRYLAKNFARYSKGMLHDLEARELEEAPVTTIQLGMIRPGPDWIIFQLWLKSGLPLEPFLANPRRAAQEIRKRTRAAYGSWKRFSVAALLYQVSDYLLNQGMAPNTGVATLLARSHEWHEQRRNVAAAEAEQIGLGAYGLRKELEAKEPEPILYPELWDQDGVDLGDGYSIHTFKTTLDVVQDGIDMDHCIWSYAIRIRSITNLLLFSVQKDGKKVASVSLVKSGNLWTVQQCYGPKNAIVRAISDKVARWVKKTQHL